MKKKFYAILLTALMLFSVGCGAAMAAVDYSQVYWSVQPAGGPGGNIGEFYTSSDVIYGKTRVTSADWTNHRFIEITSRVSPDNDIKLKAEPATIGGLTFNSKTSKDASGNAIAFGWLEGALTTDVTEDTPYYFKVTATRGSSTESLTKDPFELTFTVAVNPAIATTTPAPIVWGDKWTFKPSLSGVKEGYYVSADWKLETSGDTYLSKDVLSSDAIQFDSKTGTLSGTWKPAYCSTDITSPDWKSPDVELKDITTRQIKLKVTRGSGDRAVSSDKIFTLTFKAVAPKIMSNDTDITNALKAIDSNKGFMWSKDITAGNGVSITAEGPGIISWDVNGYSVVSSTDANPNVVSDDSLGLVYDAKQEGYTSTLRIYGYPTTTVKNMAFPITAKNPAGSTTVTALLSIGSNSFDVQVVQTSADLPSGDVRVGDNIGTVILEAQPGPVTWEVSENLPAGLTLTPLEDGKRAILTGTFSTPRTVEGGITYKITATNPVLASSDVKSADIKVWGKPEVSNLYAFAAKNTITTKKEYKWELTATNFPNSQDWEVEIDGLKEIVTGKKWSVKDGTSNISLDIVSEDGGYKAKLTGSIDRVPEDGVFTVKVTAKNYYGKSDTETFVVNVDGVAPVMTAQSFVLNTAKTGKADVDKGDAPLKMTATITDSKTLAAFGVSDPITLTDTADVYTGLSFVVSSDDGKATFKYSKPPKGDVAYTQLPVRVTAENTADSSLKPASVTHRITVTGQSPSFVNSNDIRSTYCDILKDSADVPAAVTLTMTAGKTLPVTDANGRIVFKIEGARPLKTTIKPATANGIEVATEENGTLLTFTGTPTATKKDVTSKFTVTTTNPLTNESKKIVVTVVAKPKPVIDTSKTLDKEVLVGKKVKITPKATVTTTGMKWKVTKVSGGDQNGGGIVNNEKTLYDQYGLEFDTTKGTISGTATHPTGKDNPIEVEFLAYGGTVSSDTATAKITILGAKPKLVTKKMTLTTDSSGTLAPATTGLLETNLSDANESGSTYHVANVQVEATTPLPDGITVDNTNINAPGLSGKATKATKKLATEFQLTNFGTVGKGKITFMVADAAPTLDAKSTTVNVGETSTVNLEVTNATNSDLKYKWKITTKPGTSGISAKIKGNGKYATLTLKVNKKVTPGTDSLVVTVTDPLTKATGTGNVSITVTSPTSTNDSPLEAGETKAETKAEAKDIAATEKEVKDVALGEGEVHMGAGRTADKLTAAQRKAIEDKGYVIAAVLPEIEVTASGQYDFEVDLDKEVKTGAELVWFAFSTKPTTDDEIVDFADEKGEETKVVPESHVVIVAPWLNAEAKYAPVIAVKADAKDADATTAEGVKEAAEAKTEE